MPPHAENAATQSSGGDTDEDVDLRETLPDDDQTPTNKGLSEGYDTRRNRSSEKKALSSESTESVSKTTSTERVQALKNIHRKVMSLQSEKSGLNQNLDYLRRVEQFSDSDTEHTGTSEGHERGQRGIVQSGLADVIQSDQSDSSDEDTISPEPPFKAYQTKARKSLENQHSPRNQELKASPRTLTSHSPEGKKPVRKVTAIKSSPVSTDHKSSSDSQSGSGKEREDEDVWDFGDEEAWEEESPPSQWEEEDVGKPAGSAEGLTKKSAITKTKGLSSVWKHILSI